MIKEKQIYNLQSHDLKRDNNFTLHTRYRYTIVLAVLKLNKNLLYIYFSYIYFYKMKYIISEILLIIYFKIIFNLNKI